MNSKVHTALIDSAGFIERGWNYQYNMIPQEYMASEETVRQYLELAEFGKFSDSYFVKKL